ATGRHPFRERPHLREHERCAAEPAHRTTEQCRTPPDRVGRNPRGTRRVSALAHSAERESRVRAAEPPPHSRHCCKDDVGRDGLREKGSANQRNGGEERNWGWPERGNRERRALAPKAYPVEQAGDP